MPAIFPLVALGGLALLALSGKKRPPPIGGDPLSLPPNYREPLTPDAVVDVPPAALEELAELVKVPATNQRPSAWRDSHGSLWSDLLAARVANLAWARVGKSDEIRDFQIREGEVRGGGWDDGLYGNRTMRQLSRFLLAGAIPPAYVPLKGAKAPEPTVEIGPVQYTPDQPSTAVSGARRLSKNTTFRSRAR